MPKRIWREAHDYGPIFKLESLGNSNFGDIFLIKARDGIGSVQMFLFNMLLLGLTISMADEPFGVYLVGFLSRFASKWIFKKPSKE